MTETNIRTLLRHWEKLQLTNPEERGIDFEQKRLRVIEQIARSFVDYYNENKFTAPYRLMVINIDNTAIPEWFSEKFKEWKLREEPKEELLGHAEAMRKMDKELEEFRHINIMAQRLINGEASEEVIKANKTEPKEEIYSPNKAQELFDRYYQDYHVLLQNSLNDHHLVSSENIKVIANLTKEYFKALHELSNSPWDPR